MNHAGIDTTPINLTQARAMPNKTALGIDPFFDWYYYLLSTAASWYSTTIEPNKDYNNMYVIQHQCRRHHVDLTSPKISCCD